MSLIVKGELLKPDKTGAAMEVDVATDTTTDKVRYEIGWSGRLDGIDSRVYLCHETLVTLDIGAMPCLNNGLVSMQADETSESGGEAMDVTPPSEEPQADAQVGVAHAPEMAFTFLFLSHLNYLISVARQNDHALIRAASASQPIPLCDGSLLKMREG